jgi:molecular chaperone GrpE (heat shock protein)
VEGSGEKPGTILETVRRGYTWKDVVLRHAQVRVAAPDATEPTPDA